MTGLIIFASISLFLYIRSKYRLEEKMNAEFGNELASQRKIIINPIFSYRRIINPDLRKLHFRFVIYNITVTIALASSIIIGPLIQAGMIIVMRRIGLNDYVQYL